MNAMAVHRWMVLGGAVLLVTVGLASGLVGAEEAPSPAADSVVVSLPHIRIDREKGYLDLTGHIIGRDCEWLELIACAAKAPLDHETIIAVDAQPSHVHAALLLLGLEPGEPLTWHRDGEDFTTTGPKGPAVDVQVIYQRDGKTVMHPVSQWVVNRETGENLTVDSWLFTGSRFRELTPLGEDKPREVYMADINGPVITLVNFGDEVLAVNNTITNRNDNEQWQPATDRIPENGTPVVLRLTPVKDEQPTPAPAKPDEPAE